MKQLSPLILLFFITISSAQTPEENIKNTVNSFFESFHARDGSGMRKWVHEDARLQRTAPNTEGVQSIRTQTFEDLIAGIVAIPDTTIFEEKLLSYSIQIDGPLAHVWTPYEFWMNNALHHSGANSIQLFLTNGTWKIIYLVDSRTGEASEE